MNGENALQNGNMVLQQMGKNVYSTCHLKVTTTLENIIGSDRFCYLAVD
jgi:hypothetical protein